MYREIILVSNCEVSNSNCNKVGHSLLRLHMYLLAQIDCKELRQTSPLSHVIPPASRIILPVIFESNTKGRFQRSVFHFNINMASTLTAIYLNIYLSHHKLDNSLGCSDVTILTLKVVMLPEVKSLNHIFHISP